MGNKASLNVISYGADEHDEIAVDDAAPEDERSRPLPVLRRDDDDGELDADKFVPPDDERAAASRAAVATRLRPRKFRGNGSRRERVVARLGRGDAAGRRLIARLGRGDAVRRRRG